MSHTYPRSGNNNRHRARGQQEARRFADAGRLERKHVVADVGALR